MTAGLMTPAIEIKLKEYKKKFKRDFVLEIEAPEDDEAARIAAIEKYLESGKPQVISGPVEYY